MRGSKKVKYLKHLGFSCTFSKFPYAIEVLEVVASSLECLAYYSHHIIRFLMERASHAMVVDSCAHCNRNNIVNKDNNYNINLDYHSMQFFFPSIGRQPTT